MVYSEGLNGCQVPVIMTLSESLSQGMTMLKGKSTFLQVDLSQSATKVQEPKATSQGSDLSPTPTGNPTWAFPPKAEGQIGMTMEVSELLSWAALNTSDIASGSSTPKRPGSLALATPLPLKPEDSTRLDTSSQVRTPKDAEMDNPTLEEIHVYLPPLANTPGPSREVPSMNVGQLQEEANKALDCLLVTRSSLAARQRRQVSDFGMALHQIESETTEAIKEVRALCAHTIWDVETCWTALISETKVQHATCLKGIEDECALALAEAENHCSTTIREAESNIISRAHSTQQSHAKDIQCLEVEAIGEVRNHLAFLTACSAALRAGPPKGHGIMVTPYHLLLGNAPMSTLLNIPPGVSPPEWESAPQTPPSTAPAATGPSSQSKWWHHLPDWVGSLPHLRLLPK